MLKTLFLHPLGPSLILALGGFLLLPLSGRSAFVRRGSGDLPYRATGRWALLLSFLVLAAAAAVLVRLRASAGGPVTLQWAWQPLTVAGSSLSWRLDGWNWLAALLILCICAAVLALLTMAPVDQDGGSDLKAGQAIRSLWLAAAAAAFVCSDNLVTLAGCWVALDAALALRLLPGVRAQPAARAWGGLSLAGLLVLAALIFQGESNARTALSGGAFSQPVLALLWLAALVRAGAYPLHLWLFGADRAGADRAGVHGIGEAGLAAGDRVALHLIGPATGIWLLARLQSAGPVWLHRPEWAVLGAFALIGTALAAWTAPDPARAWRWIAVNRASLVVLTAYVAAAGGPSALALSLVAFALGAGLLALGQAVRVGWGWSLPAWLGALALWGLPGTPGFLARSALALPAGLGLPAPGGSAVLIPAGILLFGLIVVAETLLVAALWHAAGGATLAVVAERAAADRKALGRSAASNGTLAAGTLAAAAQGDAAAGANGASRMLLGAREHVDAGIPVALPFTTFPAAASRGEVAVAEAVGWPVNGELRLGAPAGAGPASDGVEIIGPGGAAVRSNGSPRPDERVGGASQSFASLLRSFIGAPAARPRTTNGKAGSLPAEAAVNGGQSAGRLNPGRNLAAGWALLPLAAVTILLAVPLVAWGLWPHQLAMLAGLPSGSVPATLAQALAGTRRSVWIGLAIAGPGGCLLGWLRAWIFQGMRGWQEGALAVVSLEWANQATAFALQLAGSGLRYFARLGEGEGYIGWLALAALVLWVLLRS